MATNYKEKKLQSGSCMAHIFLIFFFITITSKREQGSHFSSTSLYYNVARLLNIALFCGSQVNTESTSKKKCIQT